MQAKIIEDLYKLIDNEFEYVEHDCSADDIIDAIILLLGEILVKDNDECEKLDEFTNSIRKIRCKTKGHLFVHDHCGYWGHKYCMSCYDHKYPELGVLSCSEATKTFRGTEEEYENR